MTTRRFALTLSAAIALLGAALLIPASAEAQGRHDPFMDSGANYAQRLEQRSGAYQRAVPLPPRVRPVDPYYGNRPNVERRYGSGTGRHWRRWWRRPHPAYRPYGWQAPGWDRPRAYDYRY